MQTIESLVSTINSHIEQKLGGKLETIYLVGSYTSSKISESRPDINWLLVWKEQPKGEDIWILGEILTEVVLAFEGDFNVRPEFRPFKFSHPIKNTGKDVFVNISNVVFGAGNEFKQKNGYIPDYVFLGFKKSRKLVFGRDVLENIEFDITSEQIRSSAVQKITSHKIQLDRIPLAYNLDKEIPLIYNETLSHAKSLLYFALEIAMSDEELRQEKFLELFHDREKLADFVAEKFPEISKLTSVILDSKENYEDWKSDVEKTKTLYLAAMGLAGLMYQKAG